LRIWRVLSEAIFSPLENEQILNVLKKILKDELIKLSKSKQIKFKTFYNYLNKFYFDENSPFSPEFYRYYDLITKTGNFSCSTNALESINRCLKTASGSGHLSYSKSFRVIRDFQINYLLLHEDRVRNNNLNREKKTTHSREAKLET
jgi:hypothetical protein